MKYPLVIIIALLLASSCYQEVIVAEDNREVFELTVSPGVQEFIYESRDTSYTIEDPDLVLLFNDQPVELREIRTRGKSALRVQRKSYSVFLNESISIKDREGEKVRMLSRFKLLAMAMDYTYIENRIGLGILEEAGIMPLFYKYVEFRINGDTQGLYMLVEDPEQYFKEQGSEFILRRGYNHNIADAEYAPSFLFQPEEEYVTRFNQIYTNLPLYQGSELYTVTDQRIELEQYFRKMGVDYLLKNGDYTDEIYFFAMIRDDTTRYHIIPWDYDDLFRDQPHEVGVSWGMGTVFGTRYYASIQDIYDEIGDKMIFSIEDDLDYTIARDSYMYARYEKVLSELLDAMDPQFIRDLFGQIKKELSPYYADNEIVAQSAFDRDPTSH